MKKYYAYLAAMLTVVLWAVSYIWADTLLDLDIPVEFFVPLRMLLAGILMDKTLDKQILETVYNDVLNRDEDVKKPILQQIFKDREHPCWADTAWILDVTGGLPAKK